MKSPIIAWAICAASLFITGCSNINCPLDNVVMMQCNFYESETKRVLTLHNMLDVMPANSDTVLINRITQVNHILLPLREGGDLDTLLLQFSNAEEQTATDTLFVSHTRQPHFESVDCPASVFHTITAVRATSHPLSEFPLTIDSVSVVRSAVNYDDIENIRIFLRSTSDK